MIAIITSLATKLPLAFLERWLTHLEKKGDTNTERLREILKTQVEARKLQAEVIIAEQGWFFTAMIRPMIAWPIIVYVWKVVVWDTVFGLGTTPPLSGMIGEWAGIIITAYFVGRPIEKGVSSAVKAIRKI